MNLIEIAKTLLACFFLGLLCYAFAYPILLLIGKHTRVYLNHRRQR